jgi:thiol:disulfide interchange protein
MRRRTLFSLPLLALLPGLAGGGASAPRLAAKTLDQLAKPLPLPYSDRVDAKAQVAGALARARKRGVPAIVDFGANWCVDCRVLAGVLALPEMKPWMARHFELVHVDVGRFDRNLDLAARLGLAELRGAPSLLVLDPRTAKMRNPGTELALVDARAMTPQAIADWLAKWTTTT